MAPSAPSVQVIRDIHRLKIYLSLTPANGHAHPGLVVTQSLLTAYLQAIVLVPRTNGGWHESPKHGSGVSTLFQASRIKCPNRHDRETDRQQC